MRGHLVGMLSWILYAFLFASLSLAQVDFSVGQKWQIILLGIPDVSKMPLPPTDAPVWDIDLFDSETATITALKAAGKIVICYFSAGTYEDWRDDAKDFPAADLGKVLKDWPNEKWIRPGSQKVRDIMTKRIRLAAQKGCDAIDPDNVDGYQNDNGLNLKNTDSIEYMRWLQATAKQNGLQIGLKNAIDILPTVGPIMDFAVNEQCAQLSECVAYNDFIRSGKPVFHIEYPDPLNTGQANSTYCLGPGTTGMSTILKDMQLTGIAIYCDGSQVNTPTKGGTSPPRPSTPPRPSSRPPLPPIPPRSSSTRASSSTARPSSTTIRPPLPPSSTIRSSARPTSTTPPGGGGGGCRQKHWDQCGGNDWKGCTTCESPYTCKPVSPPWYSQCL